MNEKIIKILIAFFVIFFSYNVNAASPSSPILPSDNIQDPGSPSTPWGGCGPLDVNCYVQVTSFSENVTGLDYSTSTGVLSLTSGYTIPTIASTTNWNIAYSWGNHAGQGYLTSYTETDSVFMNASSSFLRVSNNLSDLTSSSTARANLGLGSLAVLNNLSTFTTDNLTEGLTNKYFSNSLSRNALSLSATGLSYSTTTGVVSLTSGYVIPTTASTTEWANKVSSQWITNGANVYYNGGNVSIGTTTDSSGSRLYLEGKNGGMARILYDGSGDFDGFLFNSVDKNNQFGGDISMYMNPEEGYSVRTSGTNFFIDQDEISFSVGVRNLGINNTGTYLNSGNFNIENGHLLVKYGGYGGVVLGSALVGDEEGLYSYTGDEQIATIDHSDTSGSLYRYANGALIMNADGFAGFGSIVDGYKLNVDGTLGADRLVMSDGVVFESRAVNPDEYGLYGQGDNLIVGFNDNLNIYRFGVNALNITDLEGNVGIGTTTPSEKLSIAGNINLTGALKLNGNAGTSGYILQSTGTGAQWVATSTLGIGGGSSQWTTNGSNIYYTTGNIGIGTTDPLYDISFEINSSSTIGSWGPQGLTGITLNSVDSEEKLLFSVAGIEHLRITNGGYIGIGTTTPTQALSVVGNIAMTGDIVPTENDTYALGSLTHVWKDLFVGAGSIYVNGQKVLQTDLSDSVVVSSDDTQNLILKTTGGGNIELNSALGGGSILLKSNVVLTAGKTFRTSDLSAVSFSDGTQSGNLKLSANTLEAMNTNGSIEIKSNGSGVTYFSGGNVGVGTTTPTAKLDVWGDMQVGTSSIPTFFVNTSTRKIGINRTPISTDPEFTVNGSIGILGTNRLHFGDTYQFGVGGELIYSPTAGNIDFGARGKYRFYADTNVNESATATMYEWHTQDSPNNGTAKMVLLNNGSLGIGTASPTATLHAQGIGNQTNGVLYLTTSSTNARGTLARLGFYSYLSLDNAGNTTLGFGSKYDGETATWVRTYTSTNNYLPFFRIGSDSKIHFGGANSSSTLDTNPTLSSKVTIDTNTGNLGVGTTVPGSKLSVVETSYSGGTVTALGQNSTFFSILGGSGLYGLIGGVNGNGNSFLQSQRVDGTATAYNLLLQPNGGNIGIGTIAPSSLLHVKSAINAHSVLTIDNTTLGYNSVIQFNEAGSSKWAMGLNKNTVNGTLDFYDITNNQPRVTFAQSGNVGIGTVTPDEKFVVSGGGTYNNVKLVTGTNGYGDPTGYGVTGNGDKIYFLDTASIKTAFGANSNNGIWVQGSTDNTSKLFSVWNSGLVAPGTPSEKFTILGSGNVGIGTVAPRNNLEIGAFPAGITGTGLAPLGIQVDANGSGFTIANSATEYTRFVSGSALKGMLGTGSVVFAIKNAGNILFSPGNTDMMTLTTTGVGIGTTTPTDKLTIDGDINTTGTLKFNGDAGTAGYVLQSTGSGAQWVATSTLGIGGGATNTFVNGGNSFGSIASLGTTDNYALTLKANNNQVAYFSPDGYSVRFGLNAGLNATTTNTFIFGYEAGATTTNISNSNFIGYQAGRQATTAYNSNFLGYRSGTSAANAYDSSFIGYDAGYQATNAYYSNFFGRGAGASASGANSANFFGNSAGSSATGAIGANFFGNAAGQNASNAPYSNFIGYQAGQSATNALNSNFLGYQSGLGATNASHSIFIGQYSGYNSSGANNSIFMGPESGRQANSASYSNFIGYQSGYLATNASNGLFFGYRSGYGDTVNNTTGNKYSILLGNYTSTGGFSNSIAIGQGVKNSAVDQLNIARVIYATNIGSSTTSTSSPATGAKVGIGTSTPGQVLTVVGNGQFTAVGSGAYAYDLNLTSDGTLTTSASDIALKENIMSIDSKDTLDKIAKLKPSTFDWKSNQKKDIGLIAQEVEVIFPELVFTNPTDNYKGVNYSRFITLLISAVQELNNKINDLKERVYTKEIKTEKLCVDDICVTRDQFKNMIQSSGTGYTQQNIITTEGDTTTTNTTSTEDNTQVTTTTEDITSDTGVVLTPTTEEIVNTETVITESTIIETITNTTETE